MSNLQEIKDQVAKEKGWLNFEDMAGVEDCPKWAVDEVAVRYAKAVSEDALKRAADRAETTSSCNNWNCQGESVDKQSILSTPIELL